MTVKSLLNGNTIIYTNNEWVYEDEISANEIRPCPKCNKLPTPEGYDACLGYIQEVKHACCGHGKNNGYKILNDGTKELILN